MTLDPIIMTFAFSAGAISFLNPCGFAMLPAYISYFIESTIKQHSLSNLAQSSNVRSGSGKISRLILDRKMGVGISIGIIITVAFVTIFGLTGLAISAAGTGITKYFPWIAVMSGIVIIGIGVSNILGKTFHINIPLPKGLVSTNIGNNNGKSSNKNNKLTYLKFFLFGIGYSIASLSCTLPVFLLVVFQGISTGGLLDGFLVFLLYALGMGIIMTGISLAISISNQPFMRLMAKLSSKINVITSIILIGAGLYLLYYNIIIGKLLVS